MRDYSHRTEAPLGGCSCARVPEHPEALAPERPPRYRAAVASGETVDAALVRAGWSAGTNGLVAAWREYWTEEISWEETWDPDDRQRFGTRAKSGEHIVIEWCSRDIYQLDFEYPNAWGIDFLGPGWLEDLQSRARKLIRAGGPFGGPPHPPERICSIPNGWRVAGDIELRYEVLQGTLACCHFIDREGNLNNLWIVDAAAGHEATFNAIDKLARPAPTLWLNIGGSRIAWKYTPWRPVLAHARAYKQELLLVCPDADTAVILAHAKGDLLKATRLSMNELRSLDVATWLADSRPESQAPVLYPSATPPGIEPQPPGPTSGPAPESEPQLPAAAKIETASAPKAPRFPLPADTSDEAMDRYFSEVEVNIPPRLIGAATAIEIWKAIRFAQIHKLLPITGSWMDVVAELHHHGYLAHLPADRATREALRLLATLSPLVQRLRHRRWGIGIASPAT